MADWITYKLKGADELSRVFKTLPQEMQRQVVVPAAKEAMDIVLKAAKVNWDRIDDPTTFPDISKNVALIEDTRFFNETGSTKISVGVRKRKRGVAGGNTFYWKHLELGTRYIRAYAPMRRALNENTQAVFQEFISSCKFQLVKLDLN
jgi:HK97 gp10 family phage protein